MNVPLAIDRIRLIALCCAILFSVVAACTQRVPPEPAPRPVTAEPPTSDLPAAVTTVTAVPPSPAPMSSALALQQVAIVGVPSDTSDTYDIATTPIEPSIAEALTTPATQSSVMQSSLEPNRADCNRSDLDDQNEVVIGSLFPLSTESVMRMGNAMRSAAVMAVTEINERGKVNGKTLRLLVADSASSPEQSAQITEQMILQECVAAIMGVFHSNVAEAVKAVAVQHHVPVIFADPYAEAITADQKAEIFRIAPLRSMFTTMMAEWLTAVGDYNQDGVVQAVVLAENSTYGQLRLDQAKELLPTYGIAVETFALDLPTEDFSSVVARVVALDMLPDVIFLNLHHPSVLSLQQQLLAAGIGPERNTLLVGTMALLDDRAYWDAMPTGNFGIALRVGPWPSTVPAFGQEFAQKYEAIHGYWPEAVAFEAYDAVYLISDAIERAASLQADDLIDALEKTDIVLASGHYQFPYGTDNLPEDAGVPDYFWHQWLEPQLLYLQYTEANQTAYNATVIWPPTYRNSNEALAPALAERLSLAQRRP